ncbi:hypothetical protein [Kaarinaea lacus]
MTHNFRFALYLTIATLAIKTQSVFMKFYWCFYETSNSPDMTGKCHTSNLMMH